MRRSNLNSIILVLLFLVFSLVSFILYSALTNPLFSNFNAFVCNSFVSLNSFGANLLGEGKALFITPIPYKFCSKVETIDLIAKFNKNACDELKRAFSRPIFQKASLYDLYSNIICKCPREVTPSLLKDATFKRCFEEWEKLYLAYKIDENLRLCWLEYGAGKLNPEGENHNNIFPCNTLIFDGIADKNTFITPGDLAIVSYILYGQQIPPIAFNYQNKVKFGIEWNNLFARSLEYDKGKIYIGGTLLNPKNNVFFYSNIGKDKEIDITPKSSVILNFHDNTVSETVTEAVSFIMAILTILAVIVITLVTVGMLGLALLVIGETILAVAFHNSLLFRGLSAILSNPIVKQKIFGKTSLDEVYNTYLKKVNELVAKYNKDMVSVLVINPDETASEAIAMLNVFFADIVNSFYYFSSSPESTICNSDVNILYNKGKSNLNNILSSFTITMEKTKTENIISIAYIAYRDTKHLRPIICISRKLESSLFSYVGKCFTKEFKDSVQFTLNENDLKGNYITLVLVPSNNIKQLITQKEDGLLIVSGLKLTANFMKNHYLAFPYYYKNFGSFRKEISMKADYFEELAKNNIGGVNILVLFSDYVESLCKSKK